MRRNGLWFYTTEGDFALPGPRPHPSETTTMKIHHATIKSAAAKYGIALSIEDDTYVVAYHDGATRTVKVEIEDEDDLASAVQDAISSMTESLEAQTELGAQITQVFDDAGTPEGWQASVAGKRSYEADSLEDLIEAIQTGEAEAEEEADDEEEGRGASVVPETFKKRYAEAGHPNTCGDWLALTINSYCHLGTKKTGQFDLDRFEAICQANGVDSAKYNRTTRGWEGRLRMTCRNLLVKVVATKGVLIIPDMKGQEEVVLDADPAWRMKNMPKAKGKAAVEAPAA